MNNSIFRCVSSIALEPEVPGEWGGEVRPRGEAGGEARGETGGEAGGEARGRR